jgi:hypothetical protein
LALDSYEKISKETSKFWILSKTNGQESFRVFDYALWREFKNTIFEQ